MGNGIELFWTLVCYAVVAGGAVLGGLVGYYWFVEIPRRELGTSSGYCTGSDAAKTVGPGWVVTFTAYVFPGAKRTRGNFQPCGLTTRSTSFEPGAPIWNRAGYAPTLCRSSVYSVAPT